MFGTVRIPATLPRLSAASIMLTFALVCAVATAAGVAAWELRNTSTTSSHAVSQATRAAYERGFAAGRAQTATTGLAKARHDSLAAGIHRGYRRGYRVGLHRGQTIGYQQGHSAGYSEGYAAALKQRSAKTGTTTTTTTH
jgi:flagellar biosynthesis/type III secretory pathway protein FliH